MKQKDFGLGVGTTILGICTMIYFLGIPDGPAAFPKMVSAIIILLGIIITAQAVWGKPPKAKKEKGKMSYKTVGLIVAYMFAYLIAFQIIGYIIPTFILIGATAVTLGYKNWKVLVPTAACVSIGLYLAFTQIFSIQFPGIFF